MMSTGFLWGCTLCKLGKLWFGGDKGRKKNWRSQGPIWIEQRSLFLETVLDAPFVNFT